MGYRSFEDLEVWKRACRLAVRVYDILRDCRDYGLKDQMTRAAVSIASNIAEGAERNSGPDFNRFIGLGPNFAHLDGETKKVQFEKVRDILSRGGVFMVYRPEGP